MAGKRVPGGRFLRLVCAATLALLLLARAALAVPANPAPLDLAQPDGRAFKAVQVGDENGARLEDLDGYTIVQDAAGRWVYAEEGEIPADLEAAIEAAPFQKLTGTGTFKPSRRVVGRDSPEGLRKHIGLPPGKAGMAEARRPDGRGRAAPDGQGGRALKRHSPPATGLADAALSEAAAGSSSPVTAKIIVLLVQFKDVKFTAGHNQVYYQNSLLSESNPNSLASYYKEVSYGLLRLQGVVAPIVTSSKNMQYYGADEGWDTDNKNGPIYELAREAVLLSNGSTNFALYDTNNDHTVDHVLVIHAGGAQESTDVADDIWSHSWDIDPPQSVDGVKVEPYFMVGENSPVGTPAHEFAHDLGVHDLYDAFTGETVVGDWDLMDHGAWNNEGAKPAHLCAYNKALLGWVTPVAVSGRRSAAIRQWETYADVFKLQDPTLAGANEYFLIENRQLVGFDAALPRSGLLIWHIDQKCSDNNGWIKMVVPELAGGSLEYAPFVSRSWNSGTSPNSDTNEGATTTAYANGIGSSAATMSAELYARGPVTLTVVGGAGSGTYQSGTVVPISATVPPGWQFHQWTGDVATVDDVHSAETTITVWSNCTVTATLLAPLTVGVATDWDWTYQNTPLTTQWRHGCVLTVAVTGDPNGNTSYGVAVTRDPSSVGQAVIAPTGDPLVWLITGGQAGVDPVGAVTLDVVVTGLAPGGQGSAAAQITVRPIGDIDGDADLDAEDKANMNKFLNSLPTSYPDRAYDLDGDGHVDAEDKAVLNRLLNSLPIQ